MRTMQEKFMDRLQHLADEHKLDLVVQYDYANTGTVMFQPERDFEPLLSVKFAFNHNYASLRGVTNPSVVNPAGDPKSWPMVTPERMDQFIDFLVDDLQAALDPALQDVAS